MSIHIRPTAAIAPDAILPGDPGRALALAQDLLEAPKMANHNRGLWGYSGAPKDGAEQLTIQSTGIGGPSAAIVLSELAELGVRRAIRIGTSVAAGPAAALGSLIVPPAAMGEDGTSKELGAPDIVPGADSLTAALAAALPHARRGLVATTDIYYARTSRGPVASGVDAYEMATAPLYALGERLGIEVGCVLVVVEAGGERLGEEQLLEAELEMGRAAAAALAG
jgi:uridine phosphorylase